LKRKQVHCAQGRNEGGKGSTIPRVPNNSDGRQMTVGRAGKSQQCHMYTGA